MRELNLCEMSWIHGGVDMVVVTDLDDEAPFVGGFNDGANFAIYSIGFSIGLACTPIVAGYRACKTVLTLAVDGLCTVGSGIYSAGAYSYHAVIG